MIIITGPGRSGTSFLAQAYATAGLDPGGEWDVNVRAGLESQRVVALNAAILKSMGTSLLGSKNEHVWAEWRHHTMLKRIVPPQLRSSARRVRRLLPWNRPRHLESINWATFDATVAMFGDDLREFASLTHIVKDPQFCLTLPVWIASGAHIEHVLVSTRRVNTMVASRRRSGQLGYRDNSDAANALLLAIGTVTSCLDDNPGVPSTLLRFPDFMMDVDRTVASLPTGGLVSRTDLRKALVDTWNPDLVSCDRVGLDGSPLWWAG